MLNSGLRCVVPAYPHRRPDTAFLFVGLGHVTRARMMQIMGLLYLAPDIQEEIIDLPNILKGRDPISAREVMEQATEQDSERQRERWRGLAR